MVLGLLKEKGDWEKEKEALNARVKELELQVKATCDVVSNSSEMAIERENEMEIVKEKSDELTKQCASMKEEKEKEKEDNDLEDANLDPSVKKSILNQFNRSLYDDEGDDDDYFAVSRDSLLPL